MKKLLEEIKKEIENSTNNEYTIIGERYVQTSTKNRREIKILHNSCGNSYWTTTYKFLKQKTRCRFCSTTRPTYNTNIFKDKVKELSNNEYEVLGEYINTHTKMDLLHKKCGNTYTTTPSHFINDGTRCTHCLHESFKTKNYSDKLNVMGKNNFKLKSEYKNYHSEIIVKHKSCGKSFITKPVNLKRQFDDFGEIYCQVCEKKLFHGEENLNEILQEMNILFKRQYRDTRCRNKKPLVFDFAIFNKKGDLTVLIEFDGYQHKNKKSIYSKGKQFEETQKRDKIKNEFSKNENIPLLRIDYWNVKKEKMKPIVKKFIEK